MRLRSCKVAISSIFKAYLRSSALASASFSLLLRSDNTALTNKNKNTKTSPKNITKPNKINSNLSGTAGRSGKVKV